MELRIAGLTAVIDGTEIVSDIDLEVRPGEVVGLVGPNGSGKSTLLRCAYRVLKPAGGIVTIEGDDIWRLSARETAQRAGVVVQETPPEFDLSVWEVVILGRAPHKGLFDGDTADDHRKVDEALARVDMEDFAERSFGSLSGGEKQRVLLARALAQDARLLVLDEPTNHLDIHFQLAIMDLVRKLRLTTLAALHDLNLAAAYGDIVYVICAGRIVAAGSPEDVLEPSLIRDVFGVHAAPLRDPLTGRHWLAFSPIGERPHAPVAQRWRCHHVASSGRTPPRCELMRRA
ncbi:MAG: ABC transporter ATP-binding protein [Chloroflexota bacterium]|nr:ABC transporter ATP-binding protein [Chloroflexota bacterium]